MWNQSLAADVAQILHCCGLWCRPATAVPIQPLTQKLPYAVGAALKRLKNNNNKEEEEKKRKEKMASSKRKKFAAYNTQPSKNIM